MEEVQKTTTCKGDLNQESGVYGEIRDAGEVSDISKDFTSAEIRSLAALCDAYFPSLPLEASGLVLDDSYCRKDVEEFYRASFPNGGGALEVADTIQSVLKPADVKFLKAVLGLLSTPLGTFVLSGRQSLAGEFPFARRFADMPVGNREKVLSNWSTSWLFLFRTIFKAFKGIIMWNHFTRVDERGRNSFWKAVGYCGPDPIAMNAPLSPKPLESSVIDLSFLYGNEFDFALASHGCKLLEPSDIAKIAGTQYSSKDRGVECDVVIVGSGSGGGVAAAVLANAGYRVIVLEKGNYMAREDLSLLEGPAIRDLYDERGLLSSDDQRIVIFAGSTVGGGSAVNWSASLRTPDHVLNEWEQRFGLRLFGSSRYQEAMDQVCERLGVQEEIEKENFQNSVLRKGCKALGYHVANVGRNAPPDHYCGWCHFGCRRGIKQATSESWLVDAANAGAVIVARCSAQRVLHMANENGLKSRKAVGVVAKIDGDGEDRQLFIKARATIVASGALRTPSLLRNSALKNPHIGKNLHLHPVQIVWGYFPPGTAVDGNCYEGGIITAFSNEAAGWKSSGYGAIIQTPVIHPGTHAMFLPWKSGSHFKENMVKYPRICSFIVLIRDKGSGTVGSKPDGGVCVGYKLSSHDEERQKEGLEKGLRVLAAAGAVEVGTQHEDMESFKVEGGSDFEEYVKKVVRKGGAPLYSAHQMGSCRMGVSAKEGAVDEMGESWEVEGLFVGDGSVVPTAIGVNPMITIQSVAFCTAQNVVEYLKRQCA